MERKAFVTRGDVEPAEPVPGFFVRAFTSEALGAKDMTTCSATVGPGGKLPYHTHPTDEVITVMVGQAELVVEGRVYTMNPYDALHVPAGVAHGARNASDSTLVLHTSFPTGAVTREFAGEFEDEHRDAPDGAHPETVVRFESAEHREVEGGEFRSLFRTKDFSGDYGQVAPSQTLPSQSRSTDTSITVAKGTAVCQVADEEHELTNFDTVCVHANQPFQIVNRGDQAVEVICIY